VTIIEHSALYESLPDSNQIHRDSPGVSFWNDKALRGSSTHGQIHQVPSLIGMVEIDLLIIFAVRIRMANIDYDSF